MENVEPTPTTRQPDTTLLAATGEPEQLDVILSRMGLAPFREDRVRRAELSLAELALRLAEAIQHNVDLALRLEKLEAAVGELRRERRAA